MGDFIIYGDTWARDTYIHNHRWIRFTIDNDCDYYCVRKTVSNSNLCPECFGIMIKYSYGNYYICVNECGWLDSSLKKKNFCYRSHLKKGDGTVNWDNWKKDNYRKRRNIKTKYHCEDCGGGSFARPIFCSQNVLGIIDFEFLQTNYCKCLEKNSCPRCGDKTVKYTYNNNYYYICVNECGWICPNYYAI